MSRRRRRTRSLRTLAALVLAAAVTAVVAAAVEAEHPARAAVRAALAEARRTVESPGERPAKLARLDEISRTLFDTKTMARRTLGPRLEGRSPAQVEAFMALFDAYIVRAYLQKLLFFRDPRFAFAPPEPAAQGDAVWIRTRIVTRKDDYFVDYRMEPRDGRWRACDVVVERVSLAENFAAQFASLLERQSFDELLERMRRKVDRRERGDAG